MEIITSKMHNSSFVSCFMVVADFRRRDTEVGVKIGESGSSFKRKVKEKNYNTEASFLHFCTIYCYVSMRYMLEKCFKGCF